MGVKVTLSSDVDDRREIEIMQAEWARVARPVVEELVSSAAPVGGPFSGSFGQEPHPGKLRDSHTSRIENGPTIIITADTDYAAAVHAGRKAVSSNSGGKLRWRDATSGVTVVAKTSPRSRAPVAGQPWMIEALLAAGFTMA